MGFDIPLLISISGFIVWALAERAYHLSGSHQSDGNRVEKNSFVLLSVAWYAATLVSFFDRLSFGWTELLVTSHWMRWAGVVLIAMGLVLRIIARRHIGKQYSVYVETSDDHHLITHGPYKVIRHPAYLGLMCLLIGIPLAAWSLPGMVSTIIFGIPAIIFRINVEEKELAKWFGEEFLTYKKGTWRLIPYIW